MPYLRRHLRTSHALALATLLCTSITACGGTQDTESDTDGEPGGIEILIDSQGIPHIYAENDEDLMYAAGYQMATDRLFQMDLLRRRALGRGAEVLGEAKVNEDAVSRIMNFRDWGKLDAQHLQTERPDDFRLFEAWVEGVNKRIEEVNAGDAPLPYGFGTTDGELNYAPEPYTVEDTFAIAKMFMFGNSNSLEFEILATVFEMLSPDAAEAIELARPAFPVYTLPPEDRPQPDTLPGLTPRAKPAAKTPPPGLAAGLHRLGETMDAFDVLGSNNWVVDGRFTENGKPLICNDPHQPLQSPSLMYAQHLNSADAGGNFDVVGFSFVGAPGLHLGHTRGVHWAATTGFADAMDLWAITVDESGSMGTVAGQQRPITYRNEVISVAGMPELALDIGEIEGYGVLLGDTLLEPLGINEAFLVGNDRRLLLNWTGFRPTSETAAFLDFARSQTVDEYEAAVDLMQVGTFNWLSADKSDISYRVNVLLPDRGDPSARKMPYTIIKDEDPATFWNGSWLPPEKLPRSRAPATGFITTANNDPWGFTGDGDVHNDPWYYGFFYAAGYRAKRLDDELQRLTQRGQVSVADMQTLLLDVYSTLADLMVPPLEGAMGRLDSAPELEPYRGRADIAEVANLIAGWDRQMTRSSAGALAFHVFAHNLTTGVLEDDLTLLHSAILGEAPQFSLKFAALAVDGTYPGGDAVVQQGADVAIYEALAATADWLTAEFGGTDPAGYSWGDRHGTEFRNPTPRLNYGWVATEGGEDTVNVSSSKFYAGEDTTQVNGQWGSHDGPIFRIVTSFDDDGVPRSEVNFPIGNSANPDSPHFDDRLMDWVDGNFRPLLFDRDEIEADLEERITLDREPPPAM